MVTNFPNGVSSWGMPVIPAGMIAPGGAVFWLDPSHPLASDENGKGGVGAKLNAPMATLPGAKDLLRANKHDMIVYKSGNISLSLTEQMDWDNDYSHLIGLCPPTRSSQRARIFQDSTATGLSPLFNLTASGCYIGNILLFQGVPDATSLLNLQVTGGRNYLWNVHAAGAGNATNAVDGCASLMVNGGEENTFHTCKLGLTTIALATGGTVLQFDSRAKENFFIDCILSARVGHVGARLVEVVDGAGVDQINYFRNTLFIANSVNQAISLESAWEIPALTGTTPIVYIDKNCDGRGFDDWDDNDRDLLYLAAGTITAGGNAGIAQLANST